MVVCDTMELYKQRGGMGMRCPVCEDVRMKEVEKNGVLIDICPECKGVCNNCRRQNRLYA